MKKIAVYSINTGLILRVVECPDEALAMQVYTGQGEAGIDITNLEYEVRGQTHYVDAGSSIQERTPYNKEVQVAGLTVTVVGLPVGTMVIAEDLNVTADEDPTELEFDIPGVYLIKLRYSAQHLDEKFEVELNG